MNPAKDIRETPRALLEQLDREFHFTLDACATHENAVCDRYWTETGLFETGRAHALDDACGLAGAWSGSVFCNPPFSELERWVEKAWEEFRRVDGPRSIVMLVPGNRQEQPFWQRLIEPERDRPGSMLTTRNLPGRIRFTVNGGQPILNPKGKVGSPNFGCVLLVWRR